MSSPCLSCAGLGWITGACAAPECIYTTYRGVSFTCAPRFACAAPGHVQYTQLGLNDLLARLLAVLWIRI
jgi:hypothetical protein